MRYDEFLVEVRERGECADQAGADRTARSVPSLLG